MTIKERFIKGIKSNKYLLFIAMNFIKKTKRSVSGKRNKIVNEGVLINVKYDIIGNENVITIKKGAIVSDTKIFIRGDRHNLFFDKNCKYKGGSLHFEDYDCSIKLGENTTVESAHIAATEPGKHILIGKDCMLSTDITFRTGDSHSIIDVATNKRINYAQNIEVGNHVWIGANVTILKGVKIGNNSIISSGAIVTNEVSENSISGGVPAKIIKTGINWSRDRIYEYEELNKV